MGCPQNSQLPPHRVSNRSSWNQHQHDLGACWKSRRSAAFQNQRRGGQDPASCENQPPRRSLGTPTLRTFPDQNSTRCGPWTQCGPPLDLLNKVFVQPQMILIYILSVAISKLTTEMSHCNRDHVTRDLTQCAV